MSTQEHEAPKADELPESVATQHSPNTPHISPDNMAVNLTDGYITLSNFTFHLKNAFESKYNGNAAPPPEYHQASYHQEVVPKNVVSPATVTLAAPSTNQWLGYLQVFIIIIALILSSSFSGSLSGTRLTSTCPVRYVFLDLGANEAISLKAFLKEPDALFNYDYPKPEGCAYQDAEIYLFEANPYFNVDLVRAKERYAPVNIHVYPSTIAWTQDTTMEFYLDIVNPQSHFWGSSVLDDARDVLRSGQVSVTLTAVDIAKFILMNFLPGDFVVIKMDIEGAELEILPHLLNMAAWVNIDVLCVEHHNVSEKRKNQQKMALEALIEMEKKGVRVVKDYNTATT